MTSVLVDLDGTLCDTRHRDHLLPDFYRHSLACVDDPPIPANIQMVNELGMRHFIVLCSGRWDHALPETEDWCRRYGVEFDVILLRVQGDMTSNPIYKLDRVKEMEAQGYTFVLAIDDYHRAATALIEYGIPTVLVTSFTIRGPWSEPEGSEPEGIFDRVRKAL